jgi:nucleotide-binding universal stress UspA family protein
MERIFVPIGGSATDKEVLETALAAARPFSGHLQFVHFHIGAGEAIPNIPHTGFAMGPALANVLKELGAEARSRSSAAAEHVRAFCASSKINFRDAPSNSHGVTASWREESARALHRLIFHARHSDLVVMGRAKTANGLPPDFLERLMMACGTPVLVAASEPRATLTGTIMVCWRETAEAARALGAAMPLLSHADRVVIAGIAEHGEDVTDSIQNVACRLAWNGIYAKTLVIVQNGRPVPDLLSSAAQGCGADLVVLGAYGRSRINEILFGSCTEAVIRHADRPTLLMH